MDKLDKTEQLSKLILVVNPGSSSRKYAVYDGDKLMSDVHFEVAENKILCTINHGSSFNQALIHIEDISSVAEQLFEVLKYYKVAVKKDSISKIAVRVVAPSSYFQNHRVLDKAALNRLKELEGSAELHIGATLKEIKIISKLFPGVKLVGISDSAFHATMPDYTSQYGIESKYASKLDIKRFGYHGISVSSVVNQLKTRKKLAERVVVCHLGSGVSVTAVKRGKSVDTTMGYSPLEGVIMATRSGSIDPIAVQALKKDLAVSETEIEDILNSHSGLLGLSQVSADLRDVLAERRAGNDKATLAVKMYVHRIQQAVAAMTASLGGIDCLVFTGIVGERSSEIRTMVISKLMFLGLHMSAAENHQVDNPKQPVDISSSGPISIYVVPSKEDSEMARLAEIIR